VLYKQSTKIIKKGSDIGFMQEEEEDCKKIYNLNNYVLVILMLKKKMENVQLKKIKNCTSENIKSIYNEDQNK
jgi:hypothetical protein